MKIDMFWCTADIGWITEHSIRMRIEARFSAAVILKERRLFI
jgi:acyl-coenzyme A synthetase/AMP-(fatty) acid ligase